jgi:hypothetical protein
MKECPVDKKKKESSLSSGGTTEQIELTRFLDTRDRHAPNNFELKKEKKR